MKKLYDAKHLYNMTKKHILCGTKRFHFTYCNM